MARALPPSPFLNEIAADLTISDGAGGRKRSKAQQLNLL